MIRIDRDLQLELGATRVTLRPRDAIRAGERLIVAAVRKLARDEYQGEKARQVRR